MSEKAKGYADSLRQQAKWIDETLNDSVPPNQRYDIGDIDTDELKAAADMIEHQAASLAAKDKEIEGLRAGISGLVNCQGKLTRAQVREACAEILGNKRIGLYNQSPFVAALAEFKARAEQAERDLANERRVVTVQSEARIKAESALAKAVEVLRPFTRYEAMAMTVSSYADYAVHVKSDVDDQPHYKHFADARAFVAQHGSDSREVKR
jgi:hypothetical protein